VFGSIGDLYRDRLRFVLDVARTYGDVAQYRVVHMRMYQINHPAGVGRLLHDNHRNYSKDVATFGTLRLILGNGLFTSDGDFWRGPPSTGGVYVSRGLRGRSVARSTALGSGNILMEPNDQYLCIVPTSKPLTGNLGNRLFLPFEGDRTLAIILSKAFLLAEDENIKDPTILHQISG
jgi:hypothetical protein